jgi:hypothetical protein
MRVDRGNHIFSLVNILAEVFNLQSSYGHKSDRGKEFDTHLICIIIRRCAFNSSSHIEHNTIFVRSSTPPSLEDGVTQFDGEVGLGLAESLHAIIKLEVGPGTKSTFFGELTNEFD